MSSRNKDGTSDGLEAIGIDRIRLSGLVSEDAAAFSDALRQYPDDVALRQELERWCAGGPAHAAAFERIDRSVRQACELATAAPIAALRSQTQARIAARARRRARSLSTVVAGLAACLMVMLAAAWFSGGSWERLQRLQAQALHAMRGEAFYRTAHGERLVVLLEDGSQMTLNTDSRAVVRYRDGIRGIRLLDGQALFEVARDPVHPFVVTGGGRRITALGTVFEVRVLPEDVAVTLVEGRIAVEPEAVDARPALPQRAVAVRTELAPGEQLLAAATATAPTIRKVDVRRQISWREGLLLFQDEPLDRAIAELNRYGTRRIELSDPALSELRISGAFNTGNVSGFVATLTSYFDVRVVETDAQRIVLAPRD